MRHKHKRRKLNDDGGTDLPPLSVGKSPNESSKLRQREFENGYRSNDTPKAFARLMNFRTKGHGKNSLDNGEAHTKKHKVRPSSTSDKGQEFSKPAEDASEVPKILPGESISDFSARVDRSLPIAGLAAKGKKINGVRDHRVTKHERRQKRLQENWRKEDARLKEKAEEERELAEEREAEERDLWEDRNNEMLSRKGKKAKRKRLVGAVPDDDDDPWAALKHRDKPRGLMDAVQAPPTFKILPKEKFKVRDGAKVEVADVPNSAGSLRRREELGSARKDVIAGYREMMNARRANR